MSLAEPSPRTWPLPVGVFAVAVVDDLVFLDVTADAYFCVPFGAREASLSPGNRALSSPDAALLDSLRDAGLIEPPGGCGTPPGLSVPSPRATAVRPVLPGPGWRDVREAAASLLDLLLHYRGRSLAELLRTAGRPSGARVPREPSPAVLEIAARYRRWVPFAPVSSKCLLRAFMLLRLLRRRGYDAHWVFGVGTWPFTAHCWLQVGDVVLDDAHERLLPYRVILVV